ncbi:GntR family transcriptional regulator [Mycolicibacterium thermoresistibile]
MPKKYGFKEKDLVVSHVVNLVLTGKLRSGDRVDRNEIARELGLSRVPIQEAVVQLEHDGLVTTQYHRGAYVERFDESVIFEHHEVYGVLTGVASARAAADPAATVTDRLEALLRVMANSNGARRFQDAAWQYRQVINDEYAGPRLGAAIRAAQTFLPRKFWVNSLPDHDELRQSYDAETAAIRAGDADAARTACAGRATTLARMMCSELVRRGVLEPTGTVSPAY